MDKTVSYCLLNTFLAHTSGKIEDLSFDCLSSDDGWDDPTSRMHHLANIARMLQEAV